MPKKEEKKDAKKGKGVVIIYDSLGTVAESRFVETEKQALALCDCVPGSKINIDTESDPDGLIVYSIYRNDAEVVKNGEVESVVHVNSPSSTE